jgi:ABC-type sulfate transport system permease component
MNRNSIFNWIVMILSSLVLLFHSSPLVGMFIHTGGAQFLETVKDKEVQAEYLAYTMDSFTATFIFAIAAVPFAWLLARKSFPLK